MAEVINPLIENEDGSYTITENHSLADVLRHLVHVEGFDAQDIKDVMEVSL